MRKSGRGLQLQILEEGETEGGAQSSRSCGRGGETESFIVRDVVEEGWWEGLVASGVEERGRKRVS